jgi:hypothetical protein
MRETIQLSEQQNTCVFPLVNVYKSEQNYTFYSSVHYFHTLLQKYSSPGRKNDRPQNHSSVGEENIFIHIESCVGSGYISPSSYKIWLKLRYQENLRTDLVPLLI